MKNYNENMYYPPEFNEESRRGFCDLCAQVLDTPSSIIEEICFWAIGSVQHIDAIMASNGVGGLTIPTNTMQELTDISNEFQCIANRLDCDPSGRFLGVDPCAQDFCECRRKPYNYDSSYGYRCCKPCCDREYSWDELCYILKEFLCINARFTIVINRLMFEGFAGQAILFEELSHFMIEQVYVARIFERILESPNLFDPRNVLGLNFYTPFGIGPNQLECAYIQMYFWNLISAQHNDLLQNVTPEFPFELPRQTFNTFQEFKILFNKPNIDLGNNFKTIMSYDCYSNRGRKIILEIAKNTLELVLSYIRFLCTLDEASQGTLLPPNTPAIFFGTREHILNESFYYQVILERIIKVLSC